MSRASTVTDVPTAQLAVPHSWPLHTSRLSPPESSPHHMVLCWHTQTANAEIQPLHTKTGCLLTSLGCCAVSSSAAHCSSSCSLPPPAASSTPRSTSPSRIVQRAMPPRHSVCRCTAAAEPPITRSGASSACWYVASAASACGQKGARARPRERRNSIEQAWNDRQ